LPVVDDRFLYQPVLLLSPFAMRPT
jgi:hypothetical protein